MAKLTKAAIEKLSNQEAMVLCNKLGIPEGSKKEMQAALVEHFKVYAMEQPVD